jgi:hypothetical protein
MMDCGYYEPPRQRCRRCRQFEGFGGFNSEGLCKKCEGEIMIDDNIRMIARELDPEEAISDEDVIAYFDVLIGAFKVHIDREKKRHGLWKDYPAADQIDQIRFKADRVKRMIERGGEGVDGEIVNEAYDIINYATFAARANPS